MIHQVSISTVTANHLREILDLQLLLMRLAERESIVTEQNVEAALRTVPQYIQSLDAVKKWFIGKNKTLVVPLNKFAAHHNPVKKRELVDDIESDIRLLFGPHSGRFRAVFKRDDDDWKASAGNFLREFYELFGSGFPEYLFTTREAYSRQNFLADFIKENDGLYMCAVCDSVGFRVSTERHTYASIDHFFPKSLYPHLAVHPYNLVPICTVCNSWFKRDENPLDTLADINELILPYRNQQGLKVQAYLHFQPRVDANTQQHPLELYFKPVVNYASERFIATYETLYEVQARWNQGLEQLDQHVFRRITQFLLGDVRNGYSPSDPHELADRIRILMALVYEEDLGHDSFGFATTWLLNYHIQCLIDPSALQSVPIYQALVVWADAQQEHIAKLQQLARDLATRIPA
jgi:5-methylcytosine-specific restriction endonuclease McrA